MAGEGPSEPMSVPDRALLLRRISLDAGGGGGSPRSAGASGTPGHGWPRTWAASSDWSARVGSTSFGETLRRSAFAAGPVTDAQDDAASSPPPQPQLGAVSASPFSGGRPGGSGGLARGRGRLGTVSTLGVGDLEESLLYDFDETLEEDEAEAAAAAPRAGGAADAEPLLRRGTAPRWHSGGAAEWDAAPFSSGSIAGASGAGLSPGGAAPAKREQSYLLTRRETSTLGPRGSLAAGAAADGGGTPRSYSEPFLVHVEQELPTSSTLQTAFNAVNLLCGVGLLTTPYAIGVSGWSALLILLAVGVVACTTGSMLARCMALDKSMRSYPDIGGAAFGTFGRVLVSCLLYLELFACCVDFVILEGDGLGALFPGASLSVAGVTLGAKQAMMVAACGVLLPTVLMRDLSVLSYLSVFGIFASLMLVALVGSTATVTGFDAVVPAVDWRGVPTAAALFSFCFSGHAVFPSLYSSLRCKRNFPAVLLSSFALVLLLYGGMAVLGALMFQDVSDNVVLDVQRAAPRAPATHVAMWTVVVNPLTKVALTLTPVAMALEELMPFRADSRAFTLASAGLRTGLLAGVLLVALCVPFFGIVMSLIGAVFSMSISIVLPCVFYHRLCSPGRAGTALCVAIGAFGIATGTWSTADAVKSLLAKY